MVCLAGASVASWAQESTVDEGSSDSPPQANQETIPEQELDVIVVTATRIETPLREVGKTVTVITEADLRRSGATSLTEAIRNVPGVRVRSTGGPGGLTTVRIRGIRSSDTMLLINGFPLRSASDPQGGITPFLADLYMPGVERIELVRGTSSALYGSDAVGGVINIISPVGKAGEHGASLSIEGGSFDTFTGHFQARGGWNRFAYGLSYTRVASDGIDAHDDYKNDLANVRLELKPHDNLGIDTHLLYTGVKAALNHPPEISGRVLLNDTDDPNDFRRNRLFNYGINVRHQLMGTWDHTLSFGGVDSNRRFFFLADPGSGDPDFFDYYHSSTYNFDYRHEVAWGTNHLLLGGIEHEREEMTESSPDDGVVVKEEFEQYRTAVYLQDQMWFLDRTLSLAVGGRVISYQTAGAHVVADGSLAYQLEATGTRLHSSVGTGFRAPALYELFGASTIGGTRYVFGNPDLEPETSLHWDFGMEQNLFDDCVMVGATYFRHDYDNIIVFRDSGYQNVTGGRSQGVELTLRVSPVENFRFSAAYTYTDGEEDTGLSLEDIPIHQYAVDIDYEPIPALELHVDGTYRGRETIKVWNSADWTSQRVESDSYFKMDARVGYVIKERAEFWARLENVFDEAYTENAYRAPGRAFYVGVRLRL